MTVSFWPMRWARDIACKSFWGFQSAGKWTGGWWVHKWVRLAASTNGRGLEGRAPGQPGSCLLAGSGQERRQRGNGSPMRRWTRSRAGGRAGGSATTRRRQMHQGRPAAGAPNPSARGDCRAAGGSPESKMMTVSAVARLMPSPPARVDSRKAKSWEPARGRQGGDAHAAGAGSEGAKVIAWRRMARQRHRAMGWPLLRGRYPGCQTTGHSSRGPPGAKPW